MAKSKELITYVATFVVLTLIQASVVIWVHSRLGFGVAVLALGLVDCALAYLVSEVTRIVHPGDGQNACQVHENQEKTAG